MQIIADTHTHTLATDHALSTLRDNARAAAALGLKAIAWTEHSPSMPGGPSRILFVSMESMPDELFGVKIIKGVEVNIMGYDGEFDLEDKLLGEMGLVIASMHTTNLEPLAKEDHTRGWLRVAENPLVDVIGHCGDMRYDFDRQRVLRAFKENGKIVEINAHSFDVRPGTYLSCEQIARMCAKLEIPVFVSSDAHHEDQIGKVALALEMLERIGFPERLVLNAEEERFFSAIDAIKTRKSAKQ